MLCNLMGIYACKIMITWPCGLSQILQTVWCIIKLNWFRPDWNYFWSILMYKYDKQTILQRDKISRMTQLIKQEPSGIFDFKPVILSLEKLSKAKVIEVEKKKTGWCLWSDTRHILRKLNMNVRSCDIWFLLFRQWFIMYVEYANLSHDVWVSTNQQDCKLDQTRSQTGFLGRV